MSTKAMQGKLWSVSPPNWVNHFEPWFLPMYKNVLTQLNLSSEDLLLDAGCGSGMFSSLAVKAGAQVIGIDAAPGLLEIARKRNPGSSFLEEDLESLPFDENRFDVVTGFNSFQYAGDFEKALEEAKRVLAPGGRLVIGIWDKPEWNDAAQVLKSIGALLPPPPPGTPGPFALSEDGKITGILKKLGLKLVYENQVPCPITYATLSDGDKSFMATGPAALAMNSNPKEAVEEAISKALKQFHVTDDFYFLDNHFLVFIAEK